MAFRWTLLAMSQQYIHVTGQVTLEAGSKAEIMLSEVDWRGSLGSTLTEEVSWCHQRPQPHHTVGSEVGVTLQSH